MSRSIIWFMARAPTPAPGGLRAVWKGPSQRGFSLVEVVVALGLTTIVLGSIFALLSYSVATTRVETERTDVQSQARNALERMSRDILEAGANLPPEFPSVVPTQVSSDLLSLMSAKTDAIEIVRSLEREGTNLSEPLRVASFDGRVATLESPGPFLSAGDLVLVFDNEPTNGTWLLGVVSSIDGTSVTIESEAGAGPAGSALPSRIHRYQRSTAERPYPTSGFIAPISVVTYYASRPITSGPESEEAQSGATLMRRVNWGEPETVAAVERLAIRYEIANTTSYVPPRIKNEFRIQGTPPPTSGGPVGTTPSNPPPNSRPSPAPHGSTAGPSLYAPVPQPDPEVPLQQVVSAVVISLTSRGDSPNLQGSRAAREGEPGYLRATLSSRVSTRNILAGMGARDRSYN